MKKIERQRKAAERARLYYREVVSGLNRRHDPARFLQRFPSERSYVQQFIPKLERSES